MKDPRVSVVLSDPHKSDNGMSRAKNSRTVCNSTSIAWFLLSSILRPLSKDRFFWWQTTGAILAELLDQAQYSWIDQCSTLYFYYTFITPRLGPRPPKSAIQPKWRSFMTDDFSPLEYSWTWSTSPKIPDVRYSVEVIGPQAGTSLDPFNQFATLELVTQLQVNLPQTDWTWFHAFYNAFQTPLPQVCEEKDTTLTTADSATQSSPSSVLLAFEHRRSKPPVPKAYFVPGLRASTTSESPQSVVAKALASLPNHSSDQRTSFPAYTYLVDFLEHHPLGKPLDLIFLAIDCLPLPQESRLKCYFRSPATDFASVSQILRLGTHPTSASDSSLGNLPSQYQLQRLESLFHAILPLTNTHNNSTSKNSKHQTAGMLFYFDCAPSQSIPKPKIYLPVKHYATSDESAWRALKDWLREEHGDKYMAQWGTRFQTLLGRMGVGPGGGDGGDVEEEEEEEGSGGGESARRVQTYVSVGFDKGGKLNVTSYFSPGVYARRV